MTRNASSFTIVGGGTAGWITAAVLSKVTKSLGHQINLVESPDIPTIGVGEATIPSIVDMVEFLGISEPDFVKNTNATFKLGIKFVDWLRLGHSYWHPFGAIGTDLNGVPFYQYWLRYFNQGGGHLFADFSPSIAMAEQNRFFIPDPNTASKLSKSAHAYHFDAGLVAGYLAEYSQRNGVTLIRDNVEEVTRLEDGRIEGVVLSNGEKVVSDFFVDCTGFRALLIGQTLGIDYEAWDQYLPVDRAVVMQTKDSGTLFPYTEATAHKHGWRWRIPLQTRMGNGYVYCSRFCSDDDARAVLLDNAPGTPFTDPRVLRFKTGKRDKMWHKNCLAVGLSSGFIEPLESTGIYLIMRAALNFIRMLPDMRFSEETSDEFNRLMDNEYECIRDFIVLHYCRSERTDSEFWRMWRALEIPESLRRKLGLFHSQGRLYINETDLFAPDSWYAVLEGMNVRPSGYDPRIEVLSDEAIRSALSRGGDELRRSVEGVPQHADFIEDLLS